MQSLYNEDILENQQEQKTVSNDSAGVDLIPSMARRPIMKEYLITLQQKVDTSFFGIK